VVDLAAEARRACPKPRESLKASVMETRVLLFGPPAIAAGVGFISITTERKPTCAEVLGKIDERFPRLRSYLGSARVAVNGEYGDEHTIVEPGDEVALICMVSGG